MTRARQLRALIESGGLSLAPGAYDGLTATLIAGAGFPLVYMTGSGTASAYGYPDYGLVTMTEMVANAGRIAAAVDVPVIADADTGYGNELNVVRTIRTIRAYERAGVAGVHLEDQTFPKRCGHLDRKTLIPLDDYLAKVRAAADARTDPDFVLIARTDARADEGFETAVRRVNAALDAGADMAFIEAPESAEEIVAVPRLVSGPCLLNVVHGGKTPPVDLSEAERQGYRVAILPGVLRSAIVGVCERALRGLYEEGRQSAPPASHTPQRLFARLGAEAWDARRTCYRVPASKGASRSVHGKGASMEGNAR